MRGVRSDVKIGLQIEYFFNDKYFGPEGQFWRTNEAIPLVGRYSSFNSDVLKQHAIWLAESGVEWVVDDWTNNLRGCDNLSQVSRANWLVINGTSFAVEGYRRLAAEGIPTPKLALLMDIVMGSVNAQDELLEWVRRSYPPSTFIELEGQPLLLMFDYGQHTTLPLNTSGFTVRWVASQLQESRNWPLADHWSWMDGGWPPNVTVRNGKAESVTISAAFFNSSGWMLARALGSDRRGGATFLEQMVTAFKTRPAFVQLHQWNEFAGAFKPYPGTNTWMDEYNVSLSDDIEPTSPAECGDVRPADSSCGGWGFLPLNLQRGFVSMLMGAYSVGGAPSAAVPPSLLVISSPAHREPVRSDGVINIRWDVLGQPASSFNVSITHDGVVVAAGTADGQYGCQSSAAGVDGRDLPLTLQICSYELLLPPGLTSGGASVSLHANGSPTPFPLARDQMDNALPSRSSWPSAAATVDFRFVSSRYSPLFRLPRS